MPTPPVVLVTGFDPFGGASRNPSGEVALALDGTTIAGAHVRGLVLPTAYTASVEAALGEIGRLHPDVVLMLGVAEGRRSVTVERVGINLDDAGIADNHGELRTEQPISPSGPAACFSPLPVRAMADAIAVTGVAAAVSTTAGTFVCNHLLYAVLAALEGSGTRAGFIHVPAIEGAAPADVPTLPLDAMIAAVGAAVRAALAN